MNKYRSQVLTDIQAHCVKQGWEYDTHFQEVAEGHLDELIDRVCKQLGIKEQSFWASYGDLVKPEDIAQRINDGRELVKKAESEQEALVTSIATATRVLISLGQIPVCLADGRETLRTKKGIVMAMEIMTLAGEATTLIAFAINEADASGEPDKVTIPGRAVYGAVTSMTETVRRITEGAWSTGNDKHDDLLMKGISADRDLLLSAENNPSSN